MKWNWVLLVLVAVARSAYADSITSVSIDDAALAAAMKELPVQLAEPIGLVAAARDPRIGLEKGDVIRAINGVPAVLGASARLAERTALVYLDVARGPRTVTIRLQVKLRGSFDKLDHSVFQDQLARATQPDTDPVLRQVTRGGAPSGVLIARAWPSSSQVEEGDIVRKVDGVVVDTVEQLITALEAAADHSRIMLGIDRLGQPVEATLGLGWSDRAIADALARIRQLDDTTYEIPEMLVDAVLAEPFAIIRQARVVPTMKDGHPLGFKIYGVQVGSGFDWLGLKNGDIVVAINGLDLTAPDNPRTAYHQLRHAMEATVAIERGGKPLTLTYKLK
jgi:hypothetical protein